MEAWLKIIAGLGLLLLSLGYLYRPSWVLRWNAWGRSLFFNDSHVLYFRRRWGLPLLITSVLFFYSGFANLAEQRPQASFELWMAYRSFLAHEYRQTVVRCEGLLVEDPKNVQAWSLLGSAWSALGDHEKAKKAWNRSLALGQTDPDGRSIKVDKP
jgi:hypothetical protein